MLKIFSKDITEYTREDFIEGTGPYEYLYLYIDEPFVMEQKRIKIDAVAKKCGVRNFTKLFKDYCKNKGREIGGLNVTNFPDQPISLRCGNYICDSSGIKLDTETVCPHPIMPVRRLINIDTGIEKIEIAFKSFGYGWRKIIFDRKIISSANKITDLSDFGVSVTSESAKGLVKFFAKMEELNGDIIEIAECVTHVGWVNHNLNDDEEKLRFVPYEKNIIFDGKGKLRTFYQSIRSKGNFEKWVSFIDEKIRKNKSIIPRIVFAASLSSVLLKPLGCLPFVIHLWGGTGTGKSVATMCAASIWADPHMGNFIQTFGATFVGMERSAAFFNSIPLFLDELQIKNCQKDFDSEIYMLTEGVGKTRGNKTGGLDLTPTWRNCTISTGERPILHSSSGGGAANRVIEVECKGRFFGDSPTDGKAAAIFLENNYGFFGRTFITYLRNNGFEHANELFDKYCDELSTVYDISQKQATAAAAILTADTLATEMLFSSTPSLTTQEISDFLKTETSVSANPRAYEYVCEYVAANQNRFMGNAEFGEVWGVMDGNSVYIMKNKFNQICDEGGYNAQSLLSWLSDRALIRRTDKKHYDVVKRIGNTHPRCVHMNLSEGDDDDYSDIDL